MVERLAALFGGGNGDFQSLLHTRLAGEIRKERRAQRHFKRHVGFVQSGSGVFGHLQENERSGAQRQARFALVMEASLPDSSHFSTKNTGKSPGADADYASLMGLNKRFFRGAMALAILFCAGNCFAGDADINLPALQNISFANGSLGGHAILCFGLVVCVIGALFGIVQYKQTRALPVHKLMADVSHVIWETCKTYLLQQGKFLAALWILIALCMIYYFAALQHKSIGSVVIILAASILGILGSYGVAWFGIRINTTANSRAAFAALKGDSLKTLFIPLKSGMSIGLLLVCVELFCMICILLFIPRELAGPCFIGFAIGESLGASALRIGGGIFTKIADIGSDLMKIVFKIKEDDPRNPGVVADCTGDNAGDSVGPTADGFETYGVTSVALIAFLAIAVNNVDIQVKLIVWIFAMRFLMDFMSGVSYFVNQGISEAKYKGLKEFDFEQPLTRLIWIASILCITTSFGMSWLLIGDMASGLWWKLASIISCGTLAAVLIPEFTKVFTSSHSKHVHEIVTASREGGASLTILSGLVAGNFSAFWKGILIAALMGVAYFVSLQGVGVLLKPEHAHYASV